MRKARRFLRLPIADQCLAAQIVILVGGVRLALSLLGFPTVRRFLLKFQHGDVAKGHDPIVVERIIRYVDAVSNTLLSQRPCLTRALVAQLLLARRYYLTTLRLGVGRSPDGRFEAHAWLERADEIVIGNLPDLESLTHLSSFDQKPS
jgi:hypothetical protein